MNSKQYPPDPVTSKLFKKAQDCAAASRTYAAEAQACFCWHRQDEPPEMGEAIAALDRLLEVLGREKSRLAAEEIRDRKPPKQRGYLDS